MSGLQKILQITGWAKRDKVVPVFIELIEKLLTDRDFCGLRMNPQNLSVSSFSISSIT